MPWSLVNAFVKPVRPPRRDDDPSLVEASIKRLDEHWDSLVDMYGADGTRVFVKVAKDAGELTHLAKHQVPTAQAVIDSVAEALTPWVGGAPA